MRQAIANTLGRVAYRFGYDAAEASPQVRRSRKISLLAEDSILNGKKRRQAVSNARELKRNFAVASWAIRTHCAHVAQHSFQSRSNDAAIDTAVERLIASWSRPKNCDASGRHSLDRLIWLAEMARVTDGEVFFYDLGDDRWQLIESDRVATPGSGGPEVPEERNADGLVFDDLGRPQLYLVCRRTKSDAREFMASLKPDRVLHHAWYDRPDQVRGVSPLMSGLNAFQDIAESAEYALAKAKIATFFGVKLKRGEDWQPDEGATQQNVKLGQGPAMFEIGHDEEAEFMHSDQPGANFREYLASMLMMSLKSLDLDFCFYDSSHTNYSGSRQALLMYRQSSAIRRREVRDILDEMTRRRLQLAIDKREIKLPRTIKTAEQLRFEWVPAGMGWIDPLKEVKSHAAAIAAGLKSRTQIARESGCDFYDVADDLAAEAEYLASKGLDTANAVQLAAIATEPTNTPELTEPQTQAEPTTLTTPEPVKLTEGQKFMATFGREQGAIYFAEGLTFEEAQTKHITWQAERIKKLESTTHRTADPVTFDAESNKPANPYAKKTSATAAAFAQRFAAKS